MRKIENVKTYEGKDLENVFFRPMFTGADARDMGVRVLYNAPVPTTLHFWRRKTDILHQYSEAGWKGSDAAERYKKTIELERVKAESAYTADEYYSLVCDCLTKNEMATMEDLTGTDLETAETALFKEAVHESLRATMWLGDMSRSDETLNTFDGFLKKLMAGSDSGDIEALSYDNLKPDNVESFLKHIWEGSSLLLKDMKSEGQLAYFVTSDVYYAYEASLEKPTLEAAYMAKMNGCEHLTYKGIPLIDVKLSEYGKYLSEFTSSFILLTDRRNLALALNTSDFPGTEVRMWYNPDEMQNRQRAIFMAGCDYLLPELISFAFEE